MGYQVRLPQISQLLSPVPEEDRPRGEEEALFWRDVAVELANLMKYGSEASQPSIVLCDMRKGGNQYLWEFCVNDLEIPQQGQYNWHGHNVSQRQYAGAIVLQDGKISRHH